MLIVNMNLAGAARWKGLARNDSRLTRHARLSRAAGEAFPATRRIALRTGLACNFPLGPGKVIWYRDGTRLVALTVEPSLLCG